jgi:parvulin-like peptidyl-prolyl isomerase
MKRLLKEPLLHFLVAAGLLFGLYAWLNPAGLNARGTEPRQVRIGEGEVRWLVETWSRQWRREPTQDELRNLVAELLKEEVLSREAREMRLDEGDTIVRRRLAQKLDFLLQDTARLTDPKGDELRRLYESHAERFQAEARVSFTQIYFSPQRRKDAAGDAKAALARLSRATPADAAALGDPSLVETALHDADERTIAAVFGPGFAQAVLVLPPGAWHGPIASGYGVHLVRVSRAAPPRPLPFEEVRAQVLELWRERQQRETEERYFRRLMNKYEVVIDASVRSIIGPLPIAQFKGPAE